MHIKVMTMEREKKDPSDFGHNAPTTYPRWGTVWASKSCSGLLDLLQQVVKHVGAGAAGLKSPRTARPTE